LGIVTCGLCSIKFDRSIKGSEYIKNKWYHPNCAKAKNEQVHLSEYICKIFRLKAVGPMNNVMIKKFINERGYTYIGIYQALKYFYEIKNNNIDKSEERIGIVPFVYDDAQNYFRYKSYRETKIEKSGIEKEDEAEPTVVIVKMPKPKEEKKSELDLLFEEE
jgi:hypothetical protein